MSPLAVRISRQCSLVWWRPFTPALNDYHGLGLARGAYSESWASTHREAELLLSGTFAARPSFDLRATGGKSRRELVTLNCQVLP